MNEEDTVNRHRLIVSAVILTAVVGAPLASAQTPANVLIAAGNGQLICDQCLTSTSARHLQPVYALVTDANGNPIQGVTVNWTAIPGTGAIAGTLSNPTSTTDNNGIALILPSLYAPYLQAGVKYDQFTVTAQAGNVTSSPFTLTDEVLDQSGNQT